MVLVRFVGVSLVLTLGLAGCMDGANGTSSSERGSRGAQVTERDVENPRAFSRREAALWDGRPSLGGVWIAHPDVTTPERVIIRNTENGRETIGALFKRERMNPGPAFQVSNEAANAINMLAGAPTVLEVVALRTEEIAPASAPEPEAVTEAAEVQVAAAPAPEAPASAAPTPAAEETPIAMAEAAEPAPARRGPFAGLFGRRNASAAPAPQAADGIETSPIDGAADLRVADDAAALPMPGPTQTAAATAPSPAQQPQASTLAQPFIQLGIFSVEANARNAEAMASSAGLSARRVAGSAQGNSFWRVVVGPAQTQAEQREMMTKVRGLGFADAYTVRR